MPPLPIHKMLLRSYEEDIKQLSSGALVTIMVFGDFGRQSIKLEKIGQLFQVSIQAHPGHPLQQTTGNSINT